MIISSFRFHPKLAALKNVTILPPAAPVVRIDGYIADAMYKDLVRIFCIVDQVYRNNVPTYITRYQGATTVCLALSLDKQTLYCNCQYLFKHIHRVFCAGAQKIFFLLHPFVPATAAIFRILPPLAHLVHIYGRNTHTRQNAAEDYAHAAKIAAFFADIHWESVESIPQCIVAGRTAGRATGSATHNVDNNPDTNPIIARLCRPQDGQAETTGMHNTTSTYSLLQTSQHDPISQTLSKPRRPPQDQCTRLYLPGLASLSSPQPALLVELWPINHIKALAVPHVPGGPWRPCIKGLPSPASPGSGCIATFYVPGGIVLREAAFVLEEAAKQSASKEHARLCILCMVHEIYTQLSTHRRNVVKYPCTIQSWSIAADEWDPACIVWPETSATGQSNGIVAPFLAWAAFIKWFKDFYVINT